MDQHLLVQEHIFCSWSRPQRLQTRLLTPQLQVLATMPAAPPTTASGDSTDDAAGWQEAICPWIPRQRPSVRPTVAVTDPSFGASAGGGATRVAGIIACYEVDTSMGSPVATIEALMTNNKLARGDSPLPARPRRRRRGIRNARASTRESDRCNAERKRHDHGSCRSRGSRRHYRRIIAPLRHASLRHCFSAPSPCLDASSRHASLRHCFVRHCFIASSRHRIITSSHHHIIAPLRSIVRSQSGPPVPPEHHTAARPPAQRAACQEAAPSAPLSNNAQLEQETAVRHALMSSLPRCLISEGTLGPAARRHQPGCSAGCSGCSRRVPLFCQTADSALARHHRRSACRGHRHARDHRHTRGNH